MVDQKTNKKKRKISSKSDHSTTTNVRNFFGDLSDDLIIDILCRVPVKLLTSFTCVCKAWHRLIIRSCIPRIYSKPPYFGLLLRQESHAGRAQGRVFSWQSGSLFSYIGIGSLFLHFNITAKEFLDSCNGLILLCHCVCDQNASASSQRLYYYYVYNSLTRQCATIIIKPSPKTAHDMYAALAYNPSESIYYKIVRFVHGCKHLYIFSSDTGDWRRVRFQLENSITTAAWVRQCVFHKGALYRVSMSGHLLRFSLDKEVSVSDRVTAIKLPEIARNVDTEGCVGLNHGNINFSMSDGFKILIWVLEHPRRNIVTDHEYDYEWMLKHTIHLNLMKINKFYANDISGSFRPFAFHPYSDVIFLGHTYWGNSVISSCNLNLNDQSPEIDSSDLIYLSSKWSRVFVFPVFQCALPLASNTLDGWT